MGPHQPARLAGNDEAWNLASDSSFLWQLQRRTHRWRPPTDAFETDEAYIIVVEVAGMRGADFAVTLDRQVLWIRGERADSSEMKAYHQMEIAYGEFETAVPVPVAVDDTKIEASYADGFLRVILPKAHARQVPISTSS